MLMIEVETAIPIKEFKKGNVYLECDVTELKIIQIQANVINEKK